MKNMNLAYDINWLIDYDGYPCVLRQHMNFFFFTYLIWQ